MSGSKAHLLILPGSMCDAWAYREQSAALAGDYEVRVPHLLTAISLGQMAEAVLALAPARFALAGHAMGGRVALEVLRRAAERVSALALIATTVHPVREAEAPRRQTQIDLARREGVQALARTWLPKVVHPKHAQDAALMQGMIDMYGRFTEQDYEREVQALLRRPDPRPLLKEICCPTLVLSGREDPLCAPELSQSIAAQIPAAHLEILDECAHFPTLEQPAAVTRALQRLLR